MAINLRPLSETAPLMVEEAEYDRLVQRKAKGWSVCADETEWLAKLHYLRAGFQAGKLDRARFEKREAQLVESWLRRGIG
jgi:hypothetical protein